MEHLPEFIMHHWLLWLALLVVLVLIFIHEKQSNQGKAKALTPAKAVDLMNHEEAQVIDLRDKESFKNGHIIGAIRMNAEEVDQKILSQYQDKPLIFVCPRGQVAPTVASKLQGLGKLNSFALEGGMSAWLGASLPLIKGK